MTVVGNTILDASERPARNAYVSIRLVAGSNSTQPGYTIDGAVVARVSLRAGHDGAWQADLIPNSEITPAGSYYAVVERPLVGGVAVHAIEVPPGGGPYELADLLTEPPPAPESLSASREYVDETFAVAQRFDVTGPADGVTDATAAFVAAAQAAVAEGRTVIYAKPGLYHCPGMTCDDMDEVYIVGDGVRFTPTTYVAAFTPAEWAQRGRRNADAGPHNGVIGIVVDDALVPQWTGLFPVMKELGAPIGVAWPSAVDRPWIKEVWRHGWEIIGHGGDHTILTSLSASQIDAMCQAEVAAIGAITGDTDNISFVYPEHARTLETDRIVSKYFISGRGVAGARILPTAAGSAWLTQAIAIGTELEAGAVAEATKRTLQGIARTNGRAVFYFHYLGNAVNNPLQDAALREFVGIVRSLGIRIELPGHVYPGRRVTPDPFFQLPVNDAWIPDAAWSLSTDFAYHGIQSFKFTPGAGFTHGAIRGSAALAVAGAAGMFTIYRASLRYKSAAGVTCSSSDTAGLHFKGAFLARDQASLDVSLGTAEVNRYPLTGTSIPAADWARVASAFIVGPDITQWTPHLQATNISGGQDPFYVSDLRWELVDRVSALVFTATLAGTTGVAINTNIVRVARYGITITAQGAHAGRLHYTTTVNDRITVFSTDAADTATVVVTVTPHLSYTDLSFPASGA